MSIERQLSDKQVRLQDVLDSMEAVGQAAEDEGRELTAEDEKIWAKLDAESKDLEQSIKTLNSVKASQDRIKAAKIQTPVPAAEPTGLTVSAARSVPARVRYTKSKVFDSTADAYECGRWLQATVGRHGPSMRFCQERGLISNAMEGGTDTAGGFAVPDPLAATMIRLVEEFGVVPRYAREAVMSSDTLAVPKIAGHTTVYYPDEGAAITPSDLTLGQINLIARKTAALTILSTELQEDAVVSMVDQIATDFAWGFARDFDRLAFLGDGTATDNNITGIDNALAAGSNVNASGGISLGTLESMLAKLPQYAGLNPVWFMHSYTYNAIVVPALVALGGTDMRQTEAGGQMSLYGYPVVYTQVLPGSAQTTGDMPVVIGDLGLGTYYGNRRNFNVRQLNELYAASDQIGVMATRRADFNCFDVGDATNAGCIVKATITA